MHEPQFIGCCFSVDTDGSIATLAALGMVGTAIVRYLFVACTLYFLVEGVVRNAGFIPILYLGRLCSDCTRVHHLFGLEILARVSIYFG